MVPTYNCAVYLEDTLRSVLEQDAGPASMQIEVIDDHSTRDDPEEVVRRVGDGRVQYFRQARNVGHVGNFNTCIQRARGRLVHILHGDDMVRPGFYEKMGEAFERAPQIGAAYCRHIMMDEDGHWSFLSPLEEPESGILPNWLERIAVGNRLQAPSMVVLREAYERLGGFDSRIESYGEDWEMWVRIAAHYPVWYETQPLAVYRIHTKSLSGQTVRTGKNTLDLRRAIVINREVLPAERAQSITTAAHLAHAHACLRRAYRLANKGESKASMAQLRESVRFSRAPSVIGTAVGVFGVWLLRLLYPKRPRA